MPLYGILRLQDPVVFVREVKELRWNILELQRRECGETLLNRNAIVELTVDHEHRNLPVLRVIDWVELLIICGVVDDAAAVLPLGEPELFGRVTHHALIENTIMRDQALPWLVPIAGDPVDHVAAVGCTECARLVAVEEGVFLLSGFPALLQIFQWTVAPMLRD